ncbi:MAG: rhodanese-related sulfurtransferase [halophilic archaeon J07HB67]|jgi:Rhodanese-related sulfurtransferase|nr:MAG: rhodanese-related sulfurtransferase [halophilic archaeon J07HB67]
MDGEIDPAELDERLGDETDRRIVDIRNPEAFDRGHIPGAENHPLRSLPDGVEEVADADHVVTVCPRGKASVRAAELIGSFEGAADTTVESLAGGLEAWDGPLDSQQGEEGPADAGSDAPF